MRIMRTLARLGMVLHAEHRIGLVPQLGQRLVIQIRMRPLHVRRQTIWIDVEVMILRGDLHLARLVIHDRVITATVPELQLVRLATQRQLKDLVPPRQQMSLI